MNTRKGHFFVIAAATLAAIAAARAALPAYDGFNNAPRPDLAGSSNGAGWAGSWFDNGTAIVTPLALPGLTYPGLVTSPGAAVTPGTGGTWDICNYSRSFGTVAGDRVYVSFLYRPDSGYATFGGLEFGLYPRQVVVGSPLGYYLYGMMVGEGIFAVSNVPEVVGETVLLVVEIRRVSAAGPISYSLYVNPVPGAAQPAYPSAQTSVPGTTLPTSLQIKNDGGVTTDEMRVGVDWASVTPALVILIGDMNCDGAVDNGDIDGFVLALLSRSAYEAAHPGCHYTAADANGDGVVDNGDIDAFVARLLR